MNAVEIGPIPEAGRTQSATDLFLIFAGANIVATTLVTGAALVPAFGTVEALGLVAFGSVAGAALVAALAPLGPRLGVPSVIAARAALGIRGAGLLALILYVSNFAWIALNNVIAASVCASVWGGAASERAWAVGLGILATLVVAAGPRAVGLADRAAVPLMAAIGTILLAQAVAAAGEVIRAPGVGGQSLWQGLDIVIGYQVSWILMFADYSRYTRSGRQSAVAVFLGLALSSLWFMPLGVVAARAAGSVDPGAMMMAIGLGPAAALLMALGTLTTNFVNIYLSALAWKSLVPRTGEGTSVWSIGLIGAALSLLSREWLDRYGDFMLLLGGVLVPVGGVLLARFFVMRAPVDVNQLYDPRGPYASGLGFSRAGVVAWVLGGATYYASGAWGGTLPSLAVSMTVYWALGPRERPRTAGDPG